MDIAAGMMIVVVGATGTGKSAAAVSIAQKLNGEVINADAIQLYKGLDIASARIADDEMGGVRHHLFGVYGPTETRTIHDFADLCTATILDVFSRGKVAVLVGGTNLYIEKILFEDSWDTYDPSVTECIVSFTDEEMHVINAFCKRGCYDAEHKSRNDEHFPAPSVAELYSILRSCDPDTADITHPNDSRRIHQALVKIQRMGRKLSEFHGTIQTASIAQTDDSKSNGVKVKLRYKDVSVCVVQCDGTSLETRTGLVRSGLDGIHADRLNERVDAMLSKGLIFELFDMQQLLSVEKNCSLRGREIDGILQTIGFKEFVDYLEAVQKIAVAAAERCGPAPIDEVVTNISKLLISQDSSLFDGHADISFGISLTSLEISKLISLREDAIEKTKVATRQYAKRQLTWIRNRLIPNLHESSTDIYFANSADVASFSNQIEIIIQKIRDRSSGIFDPVSSSPIEATTECSRTITADRLLQRRKIFQCDDCGGQRFQGLDQLEIHMKSRKHRKHVLNTKKKQQNLSERRLFGQNNEMFPS